MNTQSDLKNFLPKDGGFKMKDDLKKMIKNFKNAENEILA